MVNARYPWKHRYDLQPIDCTKTKEMVNFNIRNFTGKWFEVYATPSCLSSLSRCTTILYTINDSNFMKIYRKYVNPNGAISREMIFINYHDQTMFLKNEANRKKCYFEISNSIFKYLSFILADADGIYYVAYTDYDNVAVLISCTKDCEKSSNINGMILSRTRSPQPQFLNYCVQVLAWNGFPIEDLEYIPQNCDFNQMFD